MKMDGCSKTCVYLLFLMLIIDLFFNAMPCVSFTSYVFGDSLVDAGNNDYIFTLSKANSPPYGIDFKPSGGRPTGRFTNGRTISDIVGKYMVPVNTNIYTIDVGDQIQMACDASVAIRVLVMSME